MSQCAGVAITMTMKWALEQLLLEFVVKVVDEFIVFKWHEAALLSDRLPFTAEVSKLGVCKYKCFCDD